MKNLFRKLTAITLALIMLLAMGATAMAARDLEPPLWEQYGFDSLEEFLYLYGMTEEEYYDYIEYYVEQAEWIEKWEADNADLVAAVMSGEYPYWEEYGCESPEQFIEWYGFETAEEAAEYALYYMALWAWYDYQQELYRAEQIEAMGGTYGIINVMYNGSLIGFTDAVPEMVNDRTMVPYRALFEAFGAAVDYDAETATVTGTLGGKTVSLVIGETQMSVNENGETKTVYLDNASYIKNGRTYIPARAVSEALGFEVLWDSNYKTVVIIDLETVIAGIDGNFTILNGLLGAAFTDAEGTYKTTLEMLLRITEFNTLDGDSVTDLTADIICFSNGQSFSMTGKLDISALFNILYADYIDYMTEEDLAVLQEWEKKLAKAEVEIIMNADEDKLYIRSVILSELIPELGADTWLEIGGISEYSDLMGYEISYEDLTVGELIYQNVSSYYYYNQIYLYESILEDAELYTDLFGDDNFVKKGNNYTYSLTLEDYLEMSGLDAEDILEFNISFTIQTDGKTVTGVSGSFVFREGGYYYYDTRYSGSFDISASKMDVIIEIHEKNTSKIEIKISSATSGSSVSVPTAPPSGDKVISIEELVYGPPPGVMPLEN